VGISTNSSDPQNRTISQFRIIYQQTI